MTCRLSDAVAARLADSGKRVVVTGASGWLGMATLELLQGALAGDFHDRVACFGSRARDLHLDDGTIVTQHPLRAMAQLPARPTIVLHLAFLTKDRAETMDEEAFVTQNRALTAMVMNALDGIGAESLFYPSSGAAWRADDDSAPPAMRIYGAMKREGEDACAAWAAQPGKRAAIVRLFNLSGPHINKRDLYALAAFITMAQAGRPIVVQARRPVVRSYVAIRELMGVIFGLLLDEAECVHRMDIAGERTVDMHALATIVSTQLGDGAINAAPIDPVQSPDIYVGDPATYRQWRDHFAIEAVTLDRQIAETAAWLARPEMQSAGSW